jgi:hypothetical protein
MAVHKLCQECGDHCPATERGDGPDKFYGAEEEFDEEGNTSFDGGAYVHPENEPEEDSEEEDLRWFSRESCAAAREVLQDTLSLQRVEARI